MSEIGYYRYKVIPTADQDVNLYINGALTSTKSIEVRDYCDGMKILKYLNNEGQYRVFNFNRFWESKDKTKEIGSSNKIITSLLTSKAPTRSVGTKNTRTISLMADDVSQAQLDILQDLWVSPRVYLYVGDHMTFEDSDWILVIVKANNPISKIRKSNYTDISIEVTLPEWYSITML